MRNIWVLLCILIAFTGCEDRDQHKEGRRDQSPAVETSEKTAVVFHDPIIPRVYELPAQALVTWRRFRADRPTLVLLADQPYLSPLPESLQNEGMDLLIHGSDGEIIRRADFDQPDPLILSPQAVRAALKANLFGEVVWLLPDDRALGAFSWDVMADQLRAVGFLGKGQKLEVDNSPGVARFYVDAKRITLVHPDAWESLHLSGPVLLHLDLSYFRSTYRSEARLPVYDLIKTLAGMLYRMELEVSAVTLSYSTLDGYVGLDGRFTLPAIATLMEQPNLLREQLPKTWNLRAKALNQLTLFNETEATALYRELLTLAPDDPAALYDMATRLFYGKQYLPGLKLIDRAVAIDPGYAVVYLSLAEKARSVDDLKNVEELLQKYLRISPDNPGIKLRLAALYREQGRLLEGQTILSELLTLPWSPVYHEQIPELIDEMRGEPLFLRPAG